MFDKVKFAKILSNINDTYNTMTEFAQKSEVNRTYLSQYINQKLESPPTPKILEKLANVSNGITTYEDLMITCGYNKINQITINSFSDCVSVEEWRILFGSYDKVKISDNAQFVFYKIIDDFDIDDCDIDKDVIEININSKNYTKYASSDIEEDLILRIFLYLMIVVSKKLNALETYNMVISVAKKLEPFKMEDSTNSQFYMCPVYGQISAGQPNWAEECIEGRIPVDPNLMNIVNPEEHFFLRVNGESMNNVVKNGAYALIHKQDMVEDGEIAVVLVNGYDATLKKFTRQGDLIILEPDSNDNSFKTQAYDKNTSIKILGKYIGKMEFN